ncbi:large conductance mechanosensitive channel [Chishuiella changwenlii]|jgi:large conductance mechanosensitive channel|uniref:Large-conductance mechanosensitive channel n=1 Tax=Chishuiella changwenlii TaxID=1434701 RepID=A0A1M6U7X7_9FLAO|nr:large conductance mechanosensitive channel protein MscL [Chishuiella changwenlii]GGE99628.1 putative large conductance mechanosensitive channel [Chishuiella changwenlii]SHK65297.1 large conductance mechanosensitive channel [Chishuiella changwenlii]
MKFFDEFKEFAIKGNVIDLAIGVVIGAAFSKIVTSLVEDIITPAILTPALRAMNAEDLAALVIPGTAIKYGSFLAATISFIIVAFSLFLIVKGVNTIQKDTLKDDDDAITQEDLLTEIRDILKEKNTL